MNFSTHEINPLYSTCKNQHMHVHIWWNQQGMPCWRALRRAKRNNPCVLDCFVHGSRYGVMPHSACLFGVLLEEGMCTPATRILHAWVVGRCLLGVSLGFGFSREAGSAWEKPLHVRLSYSQWVVICVYSSGSVLGGTWGWEYAHVSYS